MAKKKNPVSKARTRKPAPVKKPFPLGFALGSLALALALGGIITYAALNQGAAAKGTLKYAEKQISGLDSSRNLDRSHTDGPVSYPDASSKPPVGGDHNVTPQSCQVYDKAIANEHAVHALEHGAVWVTYDPSLSAKDVEKLKSKVDGDPYRLMSPYPGLRSKVSLQAWGEQLFVNSVSDKRIDQFLDLFTSGPQAQEPGAACQGTTATGPLAGATPAPSTSPTSSASPKASATPTATPSPSPTK